MKKVDILLFYYYYFDIYIYVCVCNNDNLLSKEQVEKLKITIESGYIYIYC